MTPIKILLIEDSPEDTAVLREAFAKEKEPPSPSRTFPASRMA